MSCNKDQGLAVWVSRVSQNQSFTINVTDPAVNQKKISIDANAEGRWLFRIELVDDNTDPNQPSATVPDSTQETIIHRYTEDDGKLDVIIEHSGAHTWYPIVTLLGKANADAANVLVFS